MDIAVARVAGATLLRSTPVQEGREGRNSLSDIVGVWQRGMVLEEKCHRGSVPHNRRAQSEWNNVLERKQPAGLDE